MRHEFLKGLLGGQYISPMQGMLSGMGEGVAALPRGASWGSLIGAMGRGGARGRQSAQMQNYALMDVQDKFRAAQTARERATADRLYYRDLGLKMGLPEGAPMAAVQTEQKRLYDLALKRAGLVPRIEELADGFKYWVDGPDAGKRVNPSMEIPPDSLDMNQVLSQETGMLKDFRNITKQYVDAGDSYARIEAILKDPTSNKIRSFRTDSHGLVELTLTGAADMALIFNYMKMLDPQSVVREGEFALAGKTGGLVGDVRKAFLRLVSGQMLDKPMRMNLLKQARNQYDSALSLYSNRRLAAISVAEKYRSFGLDPDRMFKGEEMYSAVLPRSFFSDPPEGVSPKVWAEMSDEEVAQMDFSVFPAHEGVSPIVWSAMTAKERKEFPELWDRMTAKERALFSK